MKRITTLVTAVTLFCLGAATASAQAPKELDPKVVEAWQNAGAKVGWYGRGESGCGQFFEAKPNDPAALPAFQWRRFESGVIVKLPAPSAPFAVDLGRTRVTDTGLKELAGLKSLQALNLGGTQVTDTGLKELAGLKSLQTLDLGDTKVTDAGMKELVGLKNLQELYLEHAPVTEAAVTELRKALPNLKILRYF